MNDNIEMLSRIVSIAGREASSAEVSSIDVNAVIEVDLIVLGVLIRSALGPEWLTRFYELLLISLRLWNMSAKI